MSKLMNEILKQNENGKDMLEKNRLEDERALSHRGQAVFTNQFIETPNYIKWLKENSNE